MIEQGQEVSAAAGEPQSDVTEVLQNWGVQFAPIRLSRAGLSPWEDLRAFLDLCRIMRKLHPDVVLTYTIKPVIWGGLAARLVGIRKTFSLITGLGYTFINSGTPKANFVGALARGLYRFTLRYSQGVFFQNPDDLAEFVDRGLVEESKCVVINGSGVDIDSFTSKDTTKPRGPTPLPTEITFLMIARLLWDKGIGEYIAAARNLTQGATARTAAWPALRFNLAGGLDRNPASVTAKQLDKWRTEGTIQYLGVLSDVRPAYQECSVYVLPSYREGTPRTVLEAMAMGLPIITTDTPGCRETVKKRLESHNQKTETDSGTLDSGYSITGELKIGANGILIPPRNPEALETAMLFFLRNPEQIGIMGRESRRYAEERYYVRKVNDVILRTMEIPTE